MIVRVTVRAEVRTECPNGGTDVTDVAVSWRPAERRNAEEIHEVIGRWAGRRTWCEEMAEGIAEAVAELVQARVTVQARQLPGWGHGVECVAVVPWCT